MPNPVAFPLSADDLVRVYSRHGGFLVGNFVRIVTKGRDKGKYLVKTQGRARPKVYDMVYPVNDGIRTRERGRYEVEGYNSTRKVTKRRRRARG
jgi:hypothetical protein